MLVEHETVTTKHLVEFVLLILFMLLVGFSLLEAYGRIDTKPTKKPPQIKL